MSAFLANRFRWFHGVILAVLVLVVILPTIAQEIYYFVDNPEYVLTINSLGVAHPPGYPLVMLLGKLFSVLLPIGTLTWRLNLLSAVFLALAVPFIAQTLYWLLDDLALAVAGSLFFALSANIWIAAVSVEIYTAQIFGVALALWLLVGMMRTPMPARRAVWLTGLGFGIAVAFHPISALLLPGLAAVWYFKRVRWSDALIAIAVLVIIPVALYLLYYPLRSGAPEAFTTVGEFDVAGNFTAQNLTTLEGLLGYVTARQFSAYFHLLPTVEQVGQTVQLFLSNFLYLGGLFGLVGFYVLKDQWRRLLVWGLLFVPYVVFFTTWGASDSNTMFGPALLLWVYPMLLGLRWFLEGTTAQQRLMTLAVLVLAFGVFNFIQIKKAENDDLYTLAAARLETYPADAVVIGDWGPTLPLYYLQTIHGQRPDVKIINVDGYYHDLEALRSYLDATVGKRPLVMVLAPSLRADVLRIFIDYHLTPLPFSTPPILTSEESLLEGLLDIDDGIWMAGYLVEKK